MSSLQTSTEAEKLNDEEIEEHETRESSKITAPSLRKEDSEKVNEQDASSCVPTVDKVRNGNESPRSLDGSEVVGKQLDGELGNLQVTSSKNSNIGEDSMVNTRTGAPERGPHSHREPQDILIQKAENPKESRARQAEFEFQNIMEQFDQGYADIKQSTSSFNNTSPKTSTNLSTTDSQAQHPPRKSSLETRQGHPPQENGTRLLQNDQNTRSNDEDLAASGEFMTEPNPKLVHAQATRLSSNGASSPKSPLSPASLHKALPPVPEPEPDLPFDFHRFLDQLRHRTADPVAKFLRSFLLEFGKKQWMVHEQVKIISDFLAFITGKMAQCEVWREVSDAEYDNAKEGMEKLVMNRLYSQTFSPVIPATSTPVVPKERKRGFERRMEPGRRGQHQEDIERDAVLAQKVRIYKWVREEHLDITPIGDGKRFLVLAQQELMKIGSYRAPRDKVICILNCCKVIFGLLKNSKAADTSADSFMPLLILVILQANPEHLVSNIQYILRFRNQEKLGGEAGYYVSSLMGAIQFVENLDRTSLTVSDEDFERNVEAAVSAIAERDSSGSQHAEKHTHVSSPSTDGVGWKSESMQGSSPTEAHSDRNAAEDTAEEKAAISGLLRSIQKPLSNIGRIFSDETTAQYPGNLRQQQTTAAPPETPRRLSPALFQPPRNSQENRGDGSGSRAPRSPRLKAEDAAARQASAEAAEAQRIHRAEHKDIVETLAGMFPTLDRDVIDDVVREKEGRVGSAVDACLALNTDT